MRSLLRLSLQFSVAWACYSLLEELDVVSDMETLPRFWQYLIALAVSYYIFEGGWPGIAILLGIFALLAIGGILMITAQSAKLTED